MPRLLYAGSMNQASWPLGPRTDAWKPIGVTSRATDVPRWSSDTPDQVCSSGCAAASFACITVVRWTAKRSVSPVGVGSSNTVDREEPTAGAPASSARTPAGSTLTAEYRRGSTLTFAPEGLKPRSGEKMRSFGSASADGSAKGQAGRSQRGGGDDGERT